MVRVFASAMFCLISHTFAPRKFPTSTLWFRSSLFHKLRPFMYFIINLYILLFFFFLVSPALSVFLFVISILRSLLSSGELLIRCRFFYTIVIAAAINFHFRDTFISFNTSLWSFSPDTFNSFLQSLDFL